MITKISLGIAAAITAAMAAHSGLDAYQSHMKPQMTIQQNICPQSNNLILEGM